MPRDELAQNSGVTPEPRPTLDAIAAHCGLSVTTVSRALRGRGEMAAETRARVLAAAHDLGYRRDGERRGRPRTGTSRLIDLVLGRFHDPYSEQVTAGAQIAAAKLGYDLVLTTERDAPRDDWPMRIRSRGSAGVVIGVITPTASQVTVLADAGIPIVLLGPRGDASLPLWNVGTTDHAGGTDAAAHLIDRGARRFVVIAGEPTFRFGRARVQGFEAETERRMPGAVVVRERADWTSGQARRATARALTEIPGDGPIGLFACSDEMAAGAYRAIAEAGLSIGRDVLVVGFDDVRGARWLQPPLTTIRQPLREMAATAVGLLADAAEGRSVERPSLELPTTLVPRASTGA